MTSIGFFGPGQMGRPMVERLAAAGHSVVVHARRGEAREELAQLGVTAVADAREAAESAEVLLICLFSDPQLSELAPSLIDAAPRGATVASHVTGSVAIVQRMAELGRSRQVAVVDAPVSGTANDIRNGRLTVMLGGEAEAVEKSALAVQAYADPVLRTGALGSALKMKLVNNLLFAANAQLLAEATALGEGLGLDGATILATLEHCSGGSNVSRYASKVGDIMTFGKGVAPFMSKDVAVCKQAADELGVTPELLLDVVNRGRLPLTS